MVEVIKVKTRVLKRRFINLPRELYRHDPLWVPPLWAEERKTYDVRNPVLARSDFALFLARESNEPLGRILAYADHHFNKYLQSEIGFFGAFECVEDPSVAGALLARAEEWLRARGMAAVRGPINPVSEQWGLLLEGYDRRPVFMAPYNPPWYNGFMENSGYRKAMDLFAYEGNAREGYRIPERFIRFRETLLRKQPSFGIRRLDFSRLDREAEHIWRISNLSYQGNWGYAPLDRGELLIMFKKLKPVADRDAILFVEDDGTPVGYCLGFPDLNVILKRIGGRLFPFGFIRLLTGVKKITDFRLWALAMLPEYRSLGLDVLLYMSLFEHLGPRGVRLEANWVLENNRRMWNALEKLNLLRTKTYRIYEKQL